jgi:hypothetical protein
VGRSGQLTVNGAAWRFIQRVTKTFARYKNLAKALNSKMYALRNGRPSSEERCLVAKLVAECNVSGLRLVQAYTRWRERRSSESRYIARYKNLATALNHKIKVVCRPQRGRACPG